jgi:hypothetical protein
MSDGERKGPDSVGALERSLQATLPQRMWRARGTILLGLVAAALLVQLVAVRVALRHALVRLCELDKCVEPQRCTAVGWLTDRAVCRVDEPGLCETSARCKSDGECGLSDGHCDPRSDADCEKSTGCKEDGRCGMVVFDDGSVGCFAVKPEHCKGSTRCEKLGSCTLAERRCQ